MKTANFSVDTDDVLRKASSIEKLAQDYERIYNEIFLVFKRVDNEWDGEDNTIFNEKVLSFHDDFEEMSLFFERVVSHLRLSVKAYNDAQKYVTNQTDYLKGGKGASSSKTAADNYTAGGGGYMSGGGGGGAFGGGGGGGGFR